MTRGSFAFALALLAYPRVASADANIVARLQGSGFTDPRPVAPIGGNPGKTLGDQRRLALQYALESWGARIDSEVPIELTMTFEELGCTATSAILGAASPTSAFGDLGALGATRADPKLFYVSALADSLVGRDLRPGEPDVEMSFNASVDGSCKDQLGGFYYGFDGKPSEGSDFVSVILHEFAHGLGISALWDPNTGAFVTGDVADAYSAQVRDRDQDKRWPELLPAERVRSATNVRQVVWDGKDAGRLVSAQFAVGEPHLSFEPAVASFSGFVADTDFGGNVGAFAPVRADLMVQANCQIAAAARGQIVLFSALTGCRVEDALRALNTAGAAGVLLPSNLDVEAPALPMDLGDRITSTGLPVLSISKPDVARIVTAARSSQLQATLSGDGMRHMGADDRQRPLLFASLPYRKGSSISHLEELVRPNQLMEPFAEQPTHDLTFTVGLLRDIGWSAACGNGAKDAGEECDEGSGNTDALADACRSDCRLARCGDGVRDRGEDCDEAGANDDVRPNACRASCKRAGCGDGVVDASESCDKGSLNSDTEPNACRASCKMPSCGDGVVDVTEQCDSGSSNSDTRAAACRRDCRPARCGDGVTDGDEECDDGLANRDAPDACRSDCTAPRCGDQIVDEGEVCDGAEDCPEDCKPARRRAGADTAMTRDDLVVDQPDGGDGDAPHDGADGCGCHVAVGRGRSVWREASVLLAILGLVVRRRRRQQQR